MNRKVIIRVSSAPRKRIWEIVLPVSPESSIKKQTSQIAMHHPIQTNEKSTNAVPYQKMSCAEKYQAFWTSLLKIP
jgi:hypothetical protein